MENKILIIGYKDVKKATKCLDWREPLSTIGTIGNFNTTYIILPTLTKKIMEEVLEKDSEYFSKLHEQIFDAVDNGLDVYIITAPQIEVGEISNYSILPFGMNRVEVKINSFGEYPDNKYLSHVKKTDGYFSKITDSEYLESNHPTTSYKRYSWRLFPLLTSLNNKNIAFIVKPVCEIFNESRYRGHWVEASKYGGLIIFMPPPTEIDLQEGIKLLLKLEAPETEEEAPEWFNEINLPTEDDLKNQIKKLKTNQIEINKQIEQKEKDLKKLQSFKWVLKLQGKPLEKAVEKAFDFLGIELEKGRVAEEDRWLVIDKNKIPIEIRGHDGSIKYDDIRQIVDRTFDANNTIGETEGILIVNPYCDTKPSERTDSFSDGTDRIKKKAISTKVALLDTKTLFAFVLRKMQGKDIKKELLDKLTQTVGVIT